MNAEPVTLARSNRRYDLLAVGLTLGLNAAVVVLCYFLALGGMRVTGWLTPRPLPQFHARLAALPAREPIAEAVAAKGRDTFVTVCALCHSRAGTGMPGLGKDLVRSDYIADRDDAALVAFIEEGRPADHPLNSTKIAMPPKGGVEALTKDDLLAVVGYLRGLQDPRRMPALGPWTPPQIVVTEADKAAALAAAGGDAELAGWIASGDKIFHSTCVACHGKGGVGIQGNGKSLQQNEFIQSLDDDGLLAFVKQGRPPGDPKNTTGIQMPPKGGNPALSDDDILDVISYLRTLQPKKAAAATK